MFTLLCILAAAYVVLKVLNTRARFAEADARREAEEERLRAEAEEAAEDELTRLEAVDVDAETVDEKAIDEEPAEEVEFEVEE